MRTPLHLLLLLLAALVLPVGLGTVTAAAAFDDLETPRSDGVTATPAPAPHDPAKPTAVVVVGDRGAVTSDVLAPYEVLASTGAVNLYTAAPSRHPVPLVGGLDLVPDYTFDEVDRLLGEDAPDVVVVPALPDVGESTADPVTDWLRRAPARGSLLLGVCSGSAVLASAGLLDGRTATSHWFRLDGFEDRHPAVRWVRGTRYVDDGDVVTTAGILSGVDGTLHVVERLLGPDAAARAADATGWPHYHRGTASAMAQASLAPADAVVGVNTAFRWDRPTTGVLLTDGVGEIELASAFDTYAQSLAVRPVAVGSGPVRSRHGLTFVPRADPAAAELDRLVVPGADAARRHAADRYADLDPVYLHHDPGFPFDGALLDLARTTDVATARWSAKVLEYPVDRLDLTGPAWPWTPALRPFGLAVLGVLVALGLLRLRTSTVTKGARSGHSGTGPPADSVVP
ncbi:DJ-1/PfpI family protein [Umezawaea endophytica]|uniref:DJ-1/PfpI family protein n=1 Tax=Umezawaea endophytica TaxID=1654476 RepID=A0A9X3AG12_9PSEU|nr:DJ-1/PfpI family protein [Umezawaea endophytica]MCS7479477.1 DJ-1/PfpI family protein [Umezawaea endophytica]